MISIGCWLNRGWSSQVVFVLSLIGAFMVLCQNTSLICSRWWLTIQGSRPSSSSFSSLWWHCCTTNKYQRTFAVCGPVMWNSCLTSVRNTELSLNCFRWEVKTSLPQSLSTWCSWQSSAMNAWTPNLQTELNYRRGYLFGARYKWLACVSADATAIPSSLASVKSRVVSPSVTGIFRLSWIRQSFILQEILRVVWIALLVCI